MLENTGGLSIWLCLIFAVISIAGIFSVYLIIKSKSIENENIDKLVELGKWFIGSVALTLSASIINDGFRERDQDVKDSALFDKYVETILAADGLEKRKLLSDYFAAVSPSGPIKNAWVEYKNIVKVDIEADKVDRKSVVELTEKKNSNNATVAELESLNKIQERIAARNESLAPPAEVKYSVPRLFIHIGNESQRADMKKLQDIVRQLGFAIPGIELIKNPEALPVNPNVRYFNEEDAESALQVVEQLKTLGYATAFPYRVKGFKAHVGTLEVWLTL